MNNKKENLIKILTEMENYWTLASGFKKLVIFSDDEQIINSLYEIILENIKLTQNQTKNQNMINIEKQVKQLKTEELNQNEIIDDDFLEILKNF